jgi:hypothetical protein
MQRHWTWIAKAWNRKPEPAAFAGLGRLYLEVRSSPRAMRRWRRGCYRRPNSFSMSASFSST